MHVNSKLIVFLNKVINLNIRVVNNFYLAKSSFIKSILIIDWVY